MWKIFAYPTSGFDEINRVIIVLFDTRRNGENIRIENNIFGREADHFSQHAIGALTNFNLALIGVSLTFFIKGHHNHRCAIAAAEFGLPLKLFFAFFERNRINNRLALNAFQTSLDHGPFRRVDHDGHARDIRL